MAFLRFLLQVLLGFVLGFAAAVFFLPDVNINIGVQPGSKGDTAQAPARVPAPAKAPAPSSPTAGTDPDNTVFGRRNGASGAAVRIDGGSPVEPPRREEPATPVVSTPAPAPAPAAPEPAPPPLVAVDTTPVDFAELCIKPAAWPPIITLNKETTAELRQGDEVIGELPFAAGEKLQVTKVFGDGTVEVRAKGAKFVVHHSITDLEPQARARLNEISGKPRAPAPQPVVPPAVQRPEPTPTRQTPTRKDPEPEPRRNNDDLDRKMRSLFGERERR
jgi:hypothetical protein